MQGCVCDGCSCVHAYHVLMQAQIRCAIQQGSLTKATVHTLIAEPGQSHRQGLLLGATFTRQASLLEHGLRFDHAVRDCHGTAAHAQHAAGALRSEGMHEQQHR